MEVKEMQAWKEKLEKACALLSKVWMFASYKYRVEFDVEYKGRECKLVVYREKDGTVFVALTKETYEKAVELSESEDKKTREVAKAVLNYVKRFSELFEVWKVKKILQEAKALPRTTRVEDGKIKTFIGDEVYEVEEGRVKELAQVDKDIQNYYEQILKNVEKEKKRELKEKLWEEEIKNNWVRRTLLGNIIWLAGIGRGEGKSGIWYFGIAMNILPTEVKEKIKNYVVYLKDTRGIQDIDSYTSPLVKPTPLPAGWYVFDRHKDTVESILRELAEKQADDKDREIVEEYRKLCKEVLR
ncbi:MAG: hypothetical protein ACO2PP_13225 [Thermocrinis sp.]|jgi:uncharacterized Zn finger protein (UPF0148 family)|uniref:hypothetical protein n=1 Tax=Thermocrinis sp. TaxID=2024383 RepID=UPI003C0F0B99